MPPSHQNTRLARLRLGRGWNQQMMAELVGLTERTYARLERGDMPNPPIRYLSNCALILDVDLVSVCEDEWLEFTPFYRHDPPPPHAQRRLAG